MSLDSNVPDTSGSTYLNTGEKHICNCPLATLGLCDALLAYIGGMTTNVPCVTTPEQAIVNIKECKRTNDGDIDLKEAA